MEIWKTIENYRKYQVSNYGRVRSVDTVESQIMKNHLMNEQIIVDVKHKGKMLKGVLRHGYYFVTLYNKYNRPQGRTFKISRLVAEYFLENPDNKPLVHHKDGNKLNNNVHNLKWVSDEEHSIIHKETNNHNWKVVRLIDKNLIFENSIKAAEYLDINYFKNSKNIKLVAQNIRRVCLGIRKKTYGFRWEYYNKRSETSS